jgi:lysyl-tRNA synthetase class 2
MSQSDWKPTASLPVLAARAELMADIRKFFGERGFLEVDTPLLSADTIVDRYIEPLSICSKKLQLPSGTISGESLYFQTSPEFAMKRLLAAGSGPIFQICKSFRGGESGPTHNPEFTMLEWYDTRLQYAEGRRQLGDFASTILRSNGFDEFTYQEVFAKFTGLDPFSSSSVSLRNFILAKTDVHDLADNDSIDDLLDIILSVKIQPNLGQNRPLIIYDWPESQAALARTRIADYGNVAERFELYCRGIELANGYCELQDAEQLHVRARQNNSIREANGKERLPENSRLAEAMRSGLPGCCGVAMGVDRLLMLRLNLESIDQAIPFPINRA